MEITTSTTPVMRSYHSEDHADNESALRAMLHVIVGVAMQERLGIPLSAAQRVDLQNIARDMAPWTQTSKMLTELAR